MEKELTLSQAQAALDEIAGHRSKLALRRVAIGERLVQLEQAAPEQYLADGNLSGHGETIELEHELGLIEKALALIDGRENAAQLDLKAAKVVDLRSRAAAKRAEVEKLRQKAVKHLAALSELEGVTYGPGILAAQRSAVGWYGARDRSLPQDFQNPFEWIADPVGPDGPARRFETPRSRTLMLEANALEYEAAILRHDVDNPVVPFKRNPNRGLQEVTVTARVITEADRSPEQRLEDMKAQARALAPAELPKVVR